MTLRAVNRMNVEMTRRRLTETKLAEVVESSQSYINRVKNGRQLPTVLFAIRIARALETSVEELWGGGVPRETDSAQVG